MIDGMFQGGALPVLERVVQFTEARQRVLAANIANLSTPYYKPQDLSPQSFQNALREAIDRRQAGANPTGGPLEMANNEQLTFTPDGIQAHPENSNLNVLYHDQNNRDLERLMQHQAENVMAHRVAIELLRTEFATIQTAIRERV